MKPEFPVSSPNHCTPAPRLEQGTQWVHSTHMRKDRTSGHKPMLQLVAGEPQGLPLKHRVWRRRPVCRGLLLLLLRDGQGVGTDPGTPGS